MGINENKNMKNIKELLPLLAATGAAITLDMIDYQTGNSLTQDVQSFTAYESYIEGHMVNFEHHVIPATSALQDDGKERCDNGSFWDEELCMCVPSWSCYILCAPDEFLHPVTRCDCITYSEFQEEFGDTCGHTETVIGDHDDQLVQNDQDNSENSDLQDNGQ